MHHSLCHTALHYSSLDCCSLHNSSKGFYDMYLFVLLSEYEVFKSAYKISNILEHSRMDSSSESFVNKDLKVVWFATRFVLVCAVVIHGGVTFGLSLKNYFASYCCQHNFWYNRSELTFVPLKMFKSKIFSLKVSLYSYDKKVLIFNEMLECQFGGRSWFCRCCWR